MLRQERVSSFGAISAELIPAIRLLQERLMSKKHFPKELYPMTASGLDLTESGTHDRLLIIRSNPNYSCSLVQFHTLRLPPSTNIVSMLSSLQENLAGSLSEHHNILSSLASGYC